MHVACCNPVDNGRSHGFGHGKLEIQFKDYLHGHVLKLAMPKDVR